MWRRRPSHANTDGMRYHIKRVSEEFEKTRKIMDEITSGDHIIVLTKSTGTHYFGAKAWTEYQLHRLHISEGPNYITFPMHDVLCVRTVKAGVTMNYIRQ